MKNHMLVLISVAVALAPVIALASTGPTVFGYAQVTGSEQFGTGGAEIPLAFNGEPIPGANYYADGIIVGMHRIRLGFKGEAVPGVNIFFQYKWDGAWTSSGIGADFGSSGVQDAYFNLRIFPEVQMQVGKFVVPIGFERQELGNKLLFIQRSMNQSLDANRSVGIMFHGTNVMDSDVYYKIGVFDNYSSDPHNAFNGVGVALPTGSGQTTVGGILSNGSGHYILAGMLGYTASFLNVELSVARADANQAYPYFAQSIDAWNVGAKGDLEGLEYMAEYSHVSSYQGIEGLGAQDWYVALAANLHQMTLTPDWLDIEPTLRIERFQWTGTNDLGSGLNNYTIGVNYSVDPNNPYAARVQLNYVVPTGASRYREDYTMFRAGASTYNPVPDNAYIYNTAVLQMQVAF
ncbi:porin [Acidithiobacillus sulfuriphilus]|uniref:Porin n=2 Tax=Acidithiobacillus sulfuriphilus TaxID=1867749 RepID=A0A3M8RU59_9PROT|nr:porin [Acidithiobacillus sulfuriphilus]RNF70724.1 porin [Acidithiobacillus sulfuriphilus]